MVKRKVFKSLIFIFFLCIFIFKNQIKFLPGSSFEDTSCEKAVVNFMGKELFEVASGLEGKTPAERVEIIEENIARFSASGAPLEEVELVNNNGIISAKHKDFEIFSVTENDALFYGLTKEELARSWLDKLKTSLKILSAKVGFYFDGTASWYGKKFHGRCTASGEVFNMHELTAAHKTLPFGSQVLVTNLRNGQSVLVKINDRGPFIKNRVIDLSQAAACKIGLTGTAPVLVEVLQ